jgi:hypothetical protein
VVAGPGPSSPPSSPAVLLGCFSPSRKEGRGAAGGPPGPPPPPSFQSGVGCPSSVRRPRRTIRLGASPRTARPGTRDSVRCWRQPAGRESVRSASRPTGTFTGRPRRRNLRQQRSQRGTIPRLRVQSTASWTTGLWEREAGLGGSAANWAPETRRLRRVPPRRRAARVLGRGRTRSRRCDPAVPCTRRCRLHW